MPGIRCPMCDQPVPDRWPNCPQCGRSVQPRCHRRRPVWVYFVVVLYLLLVATVLDVPVLLVALGGSNRDAVMETAAFSAVIFALGAALLIIPIRTQLERPV